MRSEAHFRLRECQPLPRFGSSPASFWALFPSSGLSSKGTARSAVLADEGRLVPTVAKSLEDGIKSREIRLRRPRCHPPVANTFTLWQPGATGPNGSDPGEPLMPIPPEREMVAEGQVAHEAVPPTAAGIQHREICSRNSASPQRGNTNRDSPS